MSKILYDFIKTLHDYSLLQSSFSTVGHPADARCQLGEFPLKITMFIFEWTRVNHEGYIKNRLRIATCIVSSDTYITHISI